MLRGSEASSQSCKAMKSTYSIRRQPCRVAAVRLVDADQGYSYPDIGSNVFGAPKRFTYNKDSL